MDKIFKTQHFLSILALFFTVQAIAQPTNQTFNTSGTYTVPAGYITTVKIEVWGAGGGGGGALAVHGGGGGGGAYASKELSLSAGDYSVVVGGGGAGAHYVVGTSNPAQDGQSSSFDGATVIANGGKAGTTGNGGDGGSASIGIGYTSYNGGKGGTATGGNTYGGGGGGSATTSANGGKGGNSALTGGAAQGGSGQGSGGNGGRLSTNPTNGNTPGAGGGGKQSTFGTSGSGANGRVVVTVVSYSLPVTFGKVSAQAFNNSLNVQFSTLTETNNDYFEVQVSEDGNQFATIATVASQAAGGNSDTVINYVVSKSLKDVAAISGIGLLSIIGLSFAARGRRNKWKTMAGLLVVASICWMSCTKRDAAIDTNSSKIYVRLAQIDKDKTVKYSKVVQVVIKDN